MSERGAARNPRRRGQPALKRSGRGRRRLGSPPEPSRFHTLFARRRRPAAPGGPAKGAGPATPPRRVGFSRRPRGAPASPPSPRLGGRQQPGPRPPGTGPPAPRSRPPAAPGAPQPQAAGPPGPPPNKAPRRRARRPDRRAREQPPGAAAPATPRARPPAGTARTRRRRANGGGRPRPKGKLSPGVRQSVADGQEFKSLFKILENVFAFKLARQLDPRLKAQIAYFSFISR